jgi:hypothetical protein
MFSVLRKLVWGLSETSRAKELGLRNETHTLDLP